MSAIARRAAFAAVTVCLALMVVFALAEIVLRVVEPVAPGPDEPWRNRIHRASAIPGLAYELNPGVRGRAFGVPIEINSLGMRGPERQGGDGAPRCVIAAVGDSFTFGFGVEGTKTWPSRLAERLAIDHGLPTEVLNLGVGGYGTRDEAIVVRERAIPFEPDVIVVAYVLNDPETEPIQPLHAHFAEPSLARRSAVLRRIADGWRGAQIERRGAGDYVRFLHAPGSETWDSVVEGFGEIARHTEQAGVPATVAIFPLLGSASWSAYRYADLHDRVAGAALAAGLEVVDLLPAFATALPSAWAVDPRDPHPNDAGHEAAARALAEAVAPLLRASCARG